MSIVNPDCPTGCNSILPQASSDLCDPKVLFGEIEKIYISSGDSSAFSDWTDIDEWTARINNSDTTSIDSIREFHVIADLPQATADELTISLGRKVFTPATHTINFDIDDISAENYEFGRTTSCNVLFRVWFGTKSKLFGGNDGILANVNIRPVIERGIKSINKLVGTVSWEYQFSPESTDNILENINYVEPPAPIFPQLIDAVTSLDYIIQLTFDDSMSDPVSYASDFSVRINEVDITPFGISWVHLNLGYYYIGLNVVIQPGDTVDVSIAQGHIHSETTSMYLQTVTNFPVTNTL